MLRTRPSGVSDEESIARAESQFSEQDQKDILASDMTGLDLWALASQLLSFYLTSNVELVTSKRWSVISRRGHHRPHKHKPAQRRTNNHRQ